MTSIIRNVDTNIGPRFLAVNNQSLVDTVKAALSIDQVKTTMPKNNTNKLFLTADLRQYQETVPELGGTLIPRIWLRNANDGTSSLHIGVGFFRLVCANGLVIPLGDSLYSSIRHVSGPKANNFLDILPDLMMGYVDRIKSGELIDEALDSLDVVVSNPVDVIGSLDLPNQVKHDAIALTTLERHRKEDNPHTAWGLYNLINERLRRSSRSQYAAANRDVTLLQDIIHLANNQAA